MNSPTARVGPAAWRGAYGRLAAAATGDECRQRDGGENSHEGPSPVGTCETKRRTRPRAMRPMRLYINVDHVATIRQARRTDEPDPVAAARLCEAAGATASPRTCARIAGTSRTPISMRSARRCRRCSTSSWRWHPRSSTWSAGSSRIQATLVPERREEITTEGGLDLSRRDPRLAAPSRRLDAARASGSRCSSIPTAATIDAAAGARASPRSSCIPAATRTLAPPGRQALDQLAAAAAASRAARPGGARRPRAHLSQRPADRGDPGNRGAQHRAQHREPGGHDRHGRSGLRNGPIDRRGPKVALT